MFLRGFIIILLLFRRLAARTADGVTQTPKAPSEVGGGNAADSAEVPDAARGAFPGQIPSKTTTDVVGGGYESELLAKSITEK